MGGIFHDKQALICSQSSDLPLIGVGDWIVCYMLLWLFPLLIRFESPLMRKNETSQMASTLDSIHSFALAHYVLYSPKAFNFLKKIVIISARAICLLILGNLG